MGSNASRNMKLGICIFGSMGKQSCDAQLIEKSKEKDETPLSFKKTLPNSKHRKLLGKSIDISSRFLESITFHTRDSVTVCKTSIVNCKVSIPQVSGVGCCLGANLV